MNYTLDVKLNELLNSKNIAFRKAKIDEIDNILEVYSERMKWFKENEIRQWGKYLEHHPASEFKDVIENGYFFVLEKDGKIIGEFEISEDSKYWKDDKTEAYYIYKIVTKVGEREVGKIVFDICKHIAKINNKKYLRLDCVSRNQKLNDIYENHGFKLVRLGCDDYYNYALRELKMS